MYLGLGVLVAALTFGGLTLALGGDDPRPSPPPLRTAVVHDAGVAGVSLRSAPSTGPSTARSSVPDGAGLSIACGQTGEEVVDTRAGSRVASSTWLRTGDGLFVSLLYAHIGDGPTVANCVPGGRELGTLPVADSVTNPPATTGGAMNTDEQYCVDDVCIAGGN